MNINRLFQICVTFPAIFIFPVTLFIAKWLSGLRYCKQIGDVLVPTLLGTWLGIETQPYYETPCHLQIKIRIYTQSLKSG